MPPPVVKTVRQLIFYEYAKLIARQSGFAGNYGFIMAKFKELDEGKISWSNLTREYRKEWERGKSCVYCNSAKEVSLDHIIPLSMGGPDTADNIVSSCRSCNSSKGDKDLYEWWIRDLKRDKDKIPRIALGKYLKLIYDIHKEKGTLDSVDLDGDGKLTVFDLGYVLKKEPVNTKLHYTPITKKISVQGLPRNRPARARRGHGKIRKNGKIHKKTSRRSKRSRTLKDFLGKLLR